MKETLNPFYLFQLFSIILWFNIEYYYYAGIILGISLVSLSVQVFQIRRQQRALHDRVQDQDVVHVMTREGTVQPMASHGLVPGDIFVLPKEGGPVTCDAVLISGQCIVNESSLTGESIPVPKIAISTTETNERFSIRHHGRHILFSGTKVLQTRGDGDTPTTAIVVRTGFMTNKGEIIRSIMYPKPVDFHFQNQTYYYIGALAFIALIGMIYSIVVKILAGEEARYIVLRSLDIVTVAVPPALPAALTIGIIFAQHRLKKQHIHCLSPRTINMCGLINLVCFDKTGTLTEDGLGLKCVLPAKDAKFREPIEDFQNSTDGTPRSADSPLIRALAACHSLVEVQGKLLGDPLDVIMFESTGWVLEEKSVIRNVSEGTKTVKITMARPKEDQVEKGHGGTHVEMLREFPFTSSLQRMAVIAQVQPNAEVEFYVKGAPEKVMAMCDPHSVPVDFLDQLAHFSSVGNRVIAVAYKPAGHLEPHVIAKVKREEIEHNLQLLGLVIFENQIKPDTPGVIRELQKANIRPVMLTGDNLQTAISVGRTCGFLETTDTLTILNATEEGVTWTPVESDDPYSKKTVNGNLAYNCKTPVTLKHHIAITGPSLEAVKTYHNHLIPLLLLEGTIFARVSPIEKQYVVEQLQFVGYQVAMCGDGANDCGALKAANAGISLSETEAAAAAPFTSTNPSIICVPLLLREGRCALVTFFGIFFLMATYSLCQFSNAVLLAWIRSNLSDFQYLWQDLFQLTILSIAFGYTAPYRCLSNTHPPCSLKSFRSIFSLVGHVILVLAAQTLAFKIVAYQPWYQSFDQLHANQTTIADNDRFRCYENFCVWTIGAIQIVLLSLVFARGAPFRRIMITNPFHVALVVITLTFDLLCMLGPPEPVANWLQLLVPPDLKFRFVLLGITIAYFVLALLFEKVILDILISQVLAARMRFLRSGWSEDVESGIRRSVRDNQINHKQTFGVGKNGMNGLTACYSNPTFQLNELSADGDEEILKEKGFT
ncbi:polyamine-transporting ATPase 13A3-like isoform X2 [Paramacrobiotus metropolitanus]|nr:polyamine-transporting ATPase 13A3-like isoform X2 [Paramacrobiotus metropolitanus]